MPWVFTQHQLRHALTTAAYILAGRSGLDEQSHRLDPFAGLAGPLAAADGGDRQRGGVEPGIAGAEFGAGFHEQPDHRRVPVVRGGVQRLLAEAVTDVRGEAEVEHERRRVGRPGGGRVECHDLVLGQLRGGQAHRVLAGRGIMPGEPLRRCGVPSPGRVAQFLRLSWSLRNALPARAARK